MYGTLQDSTPTRARRWSQSLSPRVVSTCLYGLATLGIALAGLVAYSLRKNTLELDNVSALALVIGVLFGVNFLALFRVYAEGGIGRLPYRLPRLAVAWAATIAALLAVMFLLKLGQELSRVWIASWFVLGLAVLLGIHALIDGQQRTGQGGGTLLRRRVLLLADGSTDTERLRQLVEKDPNLRIVDVLSCDLPHDEASAWPSSAAGTLRRSLDSGAVDHVVVASPAMTDLGVGPLLAVLRCYPLRVTLVPCSLPVRLRRLEPTRVGDLPGLTLVKPPIEGWPYIIKGVTDRVLAFFFLLLGAPLLLLLAAAVKLDSPGPALFRQRRLGFDRQAIEVLKFRTMHLAFCDAPFATTVVQASRDDARVTSVGRFLRRTSLDELPQLINVLKGDMSLVGPRPHAVAHDHYYGELIDGYLGRHRVKPGMTGLAQVKGFRGETDTVDKMRMRLIQDIYYIENWSLLLDIKIILTTLLVIVKSSNAY